MLARVVVLALAVAAAACGSKRIKPCEPVPTELIRAAGTDVFRECAVERKAVALTPLRLDYRPSGSQRCGSAEIEFVIDSTGAPIVATVREVKASDKVLSEVFAAALLTQKYQPARIGGRPVASLMTLTQAYEKVPFVVPGSRPPPSGPSC